MRPNRSNDWFRLFGEVFEEYCIDLLERAYPPSPILAQRFIPNPRGTGPKRTKVELADGLLTDGRDVVLIEMKAVWIPEKTFAPNQDPADYVRELRRRYGAAVEGSSERVKGVAQLARTVRNLAEGTWSPCSPDLARPVRVVPVLLVHDPHLDAPGHSYVLAQEFAGELRGKRDCEDDWREMKMGEYQVAHLVVLTLDDLEALETSTQHFALLDCLRDYCEASADRMLSFHNFLANSHYGKKLYQNSWLGGEALELLDRAKSVLPMEADSTDADDGGAQP